MRMNLIIILVLGLGILAGNAFAADYSQYTTEELANMRGTLQDASEEERDAFRAEWQKRLQDMTPEERQEHVGKPDNAQSQPGAGRMHGRGNAQGGGGYGKGAGRGFGRGSGKGRGGGKRWYQKIFNWDDDDDDDDDDDHDNGKKGRKSSKHYRKHYLTPVNNPTYKEECGACHFAYQPELLPSGSWGRILAGLENHFGEAIELDPESKKIIGEYLKANAAEHSSAKRAVKIMRSLGNRTPLRITQIPYIQKKHHEVSPSVLKRESIGSLSNCSTCHTTAEKGIYEDDYVVIPR